MDYYRLGLVNGLSWDDWNAMPSSVKRLCWTYLQMESEAANDRAKAVG